MHIPAYLAKLLVPILWSCEDNLRNVKETAQSVQVLRASLGVNVPAQLPPRPPYTPLPMVQNPISAQPRSISISLSYGIGSPVSSPISFCS